MSALWVVVLVVLANHLTRLEKLAIILQERGVRFHHVCGHTAI